MKAKWFSTLLIVLMFVVGMVPAAGAAPRAEGPDFTPKQDNLPDPLTTAQLELKQKALEAKLNGKARGRTHEVARGQYVELEREGEGALWTLRRFPLRGYAIYRICIGLFSIGLFFSSSGSAPAPAPASPPAQLNAPATSR